MNGFCQVVGTSGMGCGVAGLPAYDGSVVAGPGGIGVAAPAMAVIVRATRAAHTPARAMRMWDMGGLSCEWDGSRRTKEVRRQRHPKEIQSNLQEVNYFASIKPLWISRR